MPLVRFPVRNEYALGHPDLYKEADKEDPKALLDGVAVAGLVGILRQLGDLAEFAAEVFHGLQEQVMTTASRSHKLMVRVQHIESALPPLEKAVLAQTSHIHFAYTAGSEWHPRIQNEQNHFIYNDLPCFIMDSYEECRDPPRLHLLDKFDSGGPGSCLKRYSDPTFFKGVSGSSIEATNEKFQRDKKARKNKKKRSSQRNGEISRVASMSNHSGGLHLTSQAINGRTSSQTASTLDMTLKSDFGDHCNSFDSRTGSGYIECVFNLCSSSQPGEQESKESASSLMQHTGTLDSVFGDESTRIVDDNFPCSSSQEQVAPISSCVTWDEKAEIVEPKGQHCDRDEDLEVLPANFDMDTRDRGTANLKNVDQTDILLTDEATLVYNANELDEVESEPDNYMDALNTIESESENDLDCQTKREVELFSSDFNDRRKEDGRLGPEEHNSGHYPSIIESQAEPSISSTNGMPSTLHNSVPSESNLHEPKPQISGKSSVSDHLASTDVCASADSFDGSQIDSVVTDGPKAECVANDPSSSGSRICDLRDRFSDKTMSTFSESQEPPSQFSAVQSSGSRICDLQDQFGDKTISSFSESQQPPSQFSGVQSSGSRTSDLEDQFGDKTTSSFSESQQSPQSSGVQSSGSVISDLQHQFGDKTISSLCASQQPPQFSVVQSVQFWTNGSLLGLQPSKPPDFAVSNAKNQDNVSNSNCETIGPLNPTLDGTARKEKIGTLVEPAESFEMVSSSNTGKIPLPLADSDAVLEKCGGSQNSLNHGSGVGLNISAVAALKSEQLPDVKATSVEANQRNDGNSSLVFGLGHRLLVNGFRRKLSLVHDDKPVTGGLNQDSGHPFDAYRTMSNTTFMEQFRHGSPLSSLTSSPPLEHMKISFNPIDGLETSKLKLTFPDGSHCHESVKDMFASFQLVPEPSTPLHEYGSDSDDDTFCRSSPYMSDDCLSHQSEYNSEQWESGESPGGSKDNELLDAFRQESSIGIVSSSLPVEGTEKNEMHFNHELQNIYLENSAEPHLSIIDLPSFDAVNSVLKGETKSSSDPKIFRNLENPSEPTPLPPPLPPVQWRVTKSLSDLAGDKQHAVSEAFKNELDLKLLGSTITKQPEPPPIDQLLHKKENIASKRESKDEQKFNGQREASQDANGKEMDEKEDFLRQIRTKSFSLRPTVTARPTFGSAPATNVKVTAILQKANAIRQAVASDDGEDDDNWSDT